MLIRKRKSWFKRRDLDSFHVPTRFMQTIGRVPSGEQRAWRLLLCYMSMRERKAEFLYKSYDSREDDGWVTLSSNQLTRARRSCEVTSETVEAKGYSRPISWGFSQFDQKSGMGRYFYPITGEMGGGFWDWCVPDWTALSETEGILCKLKHDISDRRTGAAEPRGHSRQPTFFIR